MKQAESPSLGPQTQEAGVQGPSSTSRRLLPSVRQEMGRRAAPRETCSRRRCVAPRGAFFRSCSGRRTRTVTTARARGLTPGLRCPRKRAGPRARSRDGNAPAWLVADAAKLFSPKTATRAVTPTSPLRHRRAAGPSASLPSGSAVDAGVRPWVSIRGTCCGDRTCQPPCISVRSGTHARVCAGVTAMEGRGRTPARSRRSADASDVTARPRGHCPLCFSWYHSRGCAGAHAALRARYPTRGRANAGSPGHLCAASPGR